MVKDGKKGMRDQDSKLNKAATRIWIRSLAVAFVVITIVVVAFIFIGRSFYANKNQPRGKRFLRG